jgi:hypothetical protein
LNKQGDTAKHMFYLTTYTRPDKIANHRCRAGANTHNDSKVGKCPGNQDPHNDAHHSSVSRCLWKLLSLL